MISPDQLSERNVEDYILYVRDELGVAKGTLAPIFAGLKFFYVNTLGYDWPLFTKKKSASHAGQRLPDVRSDEDCRRLIATLEKPIDRSLFHAHLRLWPAHHRGGQAARLRGRLQADGSARHQ